MESAHNILLTRDHRTPLERRTHGCRRQMADFENRSNELCWCGGVTSGDGDLNIRAMREQKLLKFVTAYGPCAKAEG